MKIGLFSDTYLPEINGVVSSIVTLQKGLEKAGHEVFVITTHPSLLSLSYENKILRLPGIELKNMYGYVLTSPLHIRAYQYVKDMNLDVIHAHTEFGIGIFARLVARLLSLPITITYHTTYEDYTHYVNVFKSKAFDKLAKKTVSKLSKIYIDSADAIISPSEKTKKMLLGYGVENEIHVVPTGLDLDRFDPKHSTKFQLTNLKSQLKINNNEKVILFVGRIAKEKSIDLVIDGFDKIDQNLVSCHLVIVGGGPELEALKLQASLIKASNKVHFLGKVPNDQVAQYYHLSDVFVSASTTETQGMTFIEAFASHKPVFAREDEVLKNLVIEKQTGFYFKSTQDFGQKMQEFLLLSQEDVQKIQANCLSKTFEYRQETFVEKVLKVYDLAIDGVKSSMDLETIETKDNVIECQFVRRQKKLSILVSKEMFVEKGLRKGKTVNKETIDDLLSNEQYAKAYQMAIRKLASKDRSLKEMYDFLNEKTTLSIRQINQLIEHLESKGYIDDAELSKSMVNSYRALLQGKHKVIRNLRKKGIDEELIQQALSDEILEDEYENALRFAQKTKASIKDKSLRALKQSLNQKMALQGFDYEVIESVMNALNFNDEAQAEMDALRKVALKAKKRYASKHSGTALRNAMFTYLDHQGFSLDDIYIVLNEMEF